MRRQLLTATHLQNAKPKGQEPRETSEMTLVGNIPQAVQSATARAGRRLVGPKDEIAVRTRERAGFRQSPTVGSRE